MDGQMSLEDILGDMDYRAKSTAEKFLKNTRGNLMENTYLREVPTQEDYDAALAIGLLKSNVDRRLLDGWPLHKAITKPSIRDNARSEMKKMLLLAQRNGISERLFKKRLRKGLSMLDAATKRKGKISD